MHARLIAFVLFASIAVAADNFGLLPQPRAIRAGSGNPLQLSNATTIGFARAPSDEDRLAARELQRILRAAGVRATIVPARQARILLERTADDSSWTFDDAPGPQSTEAYQLRVTSTGATIRTRSARGLFYGVQTLRQLLRGRELPAVEIEDWPALRLRGFMLDLSHGPLPKMEELKRQLDFLAFWKTNQFYLYSETNIELDGFPLLSPKARLSKAQVRELIAYARERFIDVVPCLELYGHLHDLAKIERYSELGETPHGGEIDPRNPKAQELVRNWVDQFTELFPSPFFHVGMDETYELGKMPGRELTPKDAGAVYLGFFEQVSRMVAAKKGKRVMVWGDIILQHPEVIPRLPAGTIAIPWRYGDEPSYDRFVSPLAEGKVQFLAGSGVWNYYDAAPDFDHTVRNVNGLVASTRKFGGLGIVHTEWTDDGQVLLRAADPGVAYGPIGAWSEAPLTPAEFYERYARLRHPGAAPHVAKVLAVISESQAILEKTLGTRTLQSVFTNPLEAKSIERARKNIEPLRLGRRKAEEAQELLLPLAQAKDADPLFATLLYGARVLDYAALRQLYAVEMDDFRQALAKNPKRSMYRLLFGIESSDHTHSRLFDLMDAVGEIQSELHEHWLRDYLPYRMETALGRWRAEFERWRSLQARLTEGYRDYRDGDPPPALLATVPEKE